MDLLFVRYANPFSFLNGMIRSKRFCEFVDNFVKTVNDEREEKNQWEFYLHRVYDKSYNEFITDIKVIQDNQNMTEAQIETTIQNSLNILKKFNPEN